MVRAIVAACVVAVLTTCGYDADFEDCTIQCSLDTGCPDGLTCSVEGLCRSGEDLGACALPSDGTGGSITHVGGRTIHTFSATRSSSTFMPPVDVRAIELLVIGGGGGGGTTRGGGGGGAGGLVYVADYAVAQPSYVVTVGRGGAPSVIGENSTFGTITVVGGGAGRRSTMADGGSGGGVSHDANDGPAGLATAGQGNRGGLAGHSSGSSTFTGAGGGGAGSGGGIGTAGAARSSFETTTRDSAAAARVSTSEASRPASRAEASPFRTGRRGFFDTVVSFVGRRRLRATAAGVPRLGFSDLARIAGLRRARLVYRRTQVVACAPV